MTWEKVETSGVVPCKRELYASCLMEGGAVMCIMGGRGAEGKVLDDMCFLNLEEMAWTIESTSHVRVGHCMAYVDEPAAVVSFAGLNGEFKPTSAVLVYDTATKKWRKAAALAPHSPDERFAYSMASTPSGHEIYIYGGINFAENLADLHVLRPMVKGVEVDEENVKLYFEEVFT